MSYQEKRIIVNILSTLLITIMYLFYVFESYPEVGTTTDELLKFWAIAFLILIPVSIVSRIIIHILFSIGNTVANKEKEVPMDERDRIIELKSSRNGNYIFGGGLILSIGALALDYSVGVMFVSLIISGMLAMIFEGVCQLYFHRKGI